MKHESSPPPNSFFPSLSCPNDRGALIRNEEGFFCADCGREYPFRDGRVFFIDVPRDAYVAESISQKRWTTWRQNNFSYFSRYLQTCQERSLLDIGAGPSQFYALTSRCKTYVGIDFTPYPHVSVVADLTGMLPFADASFDIVFMSNTLEHIPVPQLLLAESCRVLKPGGMIIGTVPFLRDVHQAPYDFLRYTHIMLAGMLRKGGFVDIDIESIGTPYDVYRLMQYMFFSRLVEAKFCENRFLNFLAVISARFARKIIHVLHWTYQPIFSVLPPSLEYTEGYGFKARK